MKVRMLDLKKISVGKNVRESTGSVAGLAESILRDGLLNPITVEPYKTGWRVVVGHRRLAAARLNSDSHIAAVIRPTRGMTDRSRLQFVENVHREDITPDEAVAYMDAVKSGHTGSETMTHATLARIIGKSPDWVRAMYQWDRLVDKLLLIGVAPGTVAALPVGHVRRLGATKKPEDMKRIAKDAVTEGLTQREVYIRTNQANAKTTAEIAELKAAQSTFIKGRFRATAVASAKPGAYTKIVLSFHDDETVGEIIALLKEKGAHFDGDTLYV